MADVKNFKPASKSPQPEIPVPDNRIVQAENINLADPALAKGITDDTFEALAKWISDLIGVKIKKETLQTLLNSIPVVGSVFSAFDIIDDLKKLATYHNDLKKWGYETPPPWVDTGLDLLGILPLPPFKQASMGLKSVVKMAFDPKFVFSEAKMVVSGMAVGSATEFLEKLANEHLPAWEPKLVKGYENTLDGTIKVVDNLARLPQARALSSVYTFVTRKKDPAEEIKDLLATARDRGGASLKDVLHGGGQYAGFIPLILDFVRNHKTTHSPTNAADRAKIKPKAESEHHTRQRNAASGQDNVHHVEQTYPVTTKARTNGKQSSTAAQGCKSCSTAHPINLATGEEVLHQTDFASPGLVPVDFTRCYRSSHAPYDRGLLGARWTSAYTTAFTQTPESLIYHDAEGRNVRLPALAVGESHDHRFEAFVASRESATVLTLTYRNGDVDVFRADGAGQEAGGAGVRYALRTQRLRSGPELHILPAPEARRQFKDKPLAALIDPQALLVITDGHSLWLECHPADAGNFAAEGPAARKIASDLDAVHRADQQAGIAYIAGADNGPGAWRDQLVRCLGRIDQLLPDGSRHTHVTYRYAPALDAQGVPLGPAAGLDLVTQTDAAGHERHYAYADHLLTRYTDYSFDGQGFGQNLEWRTDPAWAPFPTRCVRTVADDGTEDTRLSYDTWFNETTLTDALGNVSVYTYNADNLVTGVETRLPDGSAPFLQRIWDKNGNLVREIDPEGRTTRYTYEDIGSLASVTDKAGNTTRYVYNASNDPVAIIAPDGKVWRRQYDGQGNLTAQTDPAGHTTAYAYDSLGQLVGITDAKGGKKALRYNEAGQLIAHTDCSGKTTRYSYNALGHLIASTDAAGHVTRYNTDRLGRITTVLRPDGHKENYAYDAADRLTSITDPLGRMTRFAHNGQGFVTARIDAKGQTLAYRYDAAMHLVSLTNQNGERTEFTYDAQGNLVREVGFDGLVNEYRYDRSSQLIESRQGKNHTEYERDDLGRLLKKTVTRAGSPKTQTIAYRYDALGRLIAAENAHAKLAYAYDEAGNLTEETQRLIVKRGGQTVERVFTLKYEVDPLGNRLATTLPNGRRVDTQRYGTGHWIGTLWNGTPLVDLERDDLHRETVRLLGTQSNARLTRTSAYDPLSRVTRLRLTGARHETLAGRNHAYDAVGNLTRIDDQQRGALQYDYDPLGQLIKAVQPGLTETFAFDPAGNLTDGTPQGKGRLANTAGKDHKTWEEGLDHLAEQPKFETAPKISPVTHNLLKRYLAESYEHDAEGNTIRKVHKGKEGEQPYTLNLHYDAENRLVKAIRPGPASLEAEYVYDPFGRRIAKTVRTLKAQATGTHNATHATIESESTTLFVWDGDTMVQEIHPDQTISYLYEPESFVPLAQIVSDTPETVYDPQAVEARQSREREQSARQADEAEKLAWLKVTDPTAYEHLQATLNARDQDEAATERFIRENEAKTDRIYYVNADHLGTPQEVVSDDGKVVWLARYKAWGRIHKLEKEELRQPLRFQGQYEDEETGLFYNRYRYYDSDSARYLTQDPIGLAGGPNNYAYTPSSTLWVDPQGLCSTTLNRALSGTTGDHLQAHHLIPEEVWAKKQGFLNSIGMAGQRDSAQNGILMPDSEAKARSMGRKFYHCGSHAIYSSGIENALGGIERNYNSGVITKDQAAAQVAALQQSSRVALSAPGHNPIRLF